MCCTILTDTLLVSVILKSWVLDKSILPSYTIWRHRSGSLLAQLMACKISYPKISSTQTHTTVTSQWAPWRHQHIDCLPNRLFRRAWQKHQSLALPALVRGIHQWPVDFPHKGPVTRKISIFAQHLESSYEMEWLHWMREYWHSCANNRSHVTYPLVESAQTM